MATLRDYFITESSEFFQRINDSLSRLDTSAGDPTELVRLARGLRGSAHLARETRVYRASLGLEAAARAISSGLLEWNADVSGRTRNTVDDLQLLVNGSEDEQAADVRVKQVLERWRELNVEPPIEVAAPASAARESSPSRQFREFAAHEVAGIAAEVDASLAQLAQEPRNHDPLKAILRRQRALLGAARLDEIQVVAESLRAIEDLARLIFKLNVAVKDEWAAVFRAARDALSATLEPLRAGNNPQPSPALSTLRTLRAELLERYGEGVTAPAAASGVTTTTAAATPTQSVPFSPDEVVPIEALYYSGERALRRALELRSQLEDLADNNPAARDSVDQLFDLIRLGLG